MIRHLHLLAAACLLFLGGCGHVFTLKYSATELNDRLTPLFPLQQQQGPFTVKLTEPVVRLNSTENRIGILFDVDVQGLGIRTGGTTLIEGTVEYRRDTRAFYVVKPSVQALTLKGMPGIVEVTLREAINLVGALALKDRPLYTLDPKLSKEALAITYLRTVKVSDNHLVVEVSLTQP